MPVYEIADFTKGKRTQKGRPLPADEMPQPFRVTVATHDSVDHFLGTSGYDDRAKLLRGLRDLGILVHDPGRLTQRVRMAEGKRRRYVFRGGPADVPRRRASPVVAAEISAR